MALSVLQVLGVFLPGGPVQIAAGHLFIRGEYIYTAAAYAVEFAAVALVLWICRRKTSHAA